MAAEDGSDHKREVAQGTELGDGSVGDSLFEFADEVVQKDIEPQDGFGSIERTQAKPIAGDVVRQVYRTNQGDTSLPKGNESSYSRYAFSIEVRRPGYGRFSKVFFGLFIATMIALAAFWVRPKESSPRVSLS